MTVQVRSKVAEKVDVLRRNKGLTLLGFALIITAAIIGLRIYYQSYSQLPIYSFDVTNVTPTSATLVWRTKIKARATVKIDENSRSSFWEFLHGYRSEDHYFDSRDMVENSDGEYVLSHERSYYTHHVTLTDLSPDTEYTLKMMHNRIPSSTADVFTIRTTEESEEIHKPEPIYGSVESDTIDLNDTILVAQVAGRGSLDVSEEKSSRISVPLSEFSYSLDTANLYDEGLEEQFISLLDNTTDYTIHLKIITPKGSAVHVVDNTNFQPIDTIVLEESEVDSESNILDRVSHLASPVYASCPSECVGDCQGCNLDSATNPLCITYGCGYMSWCCGYGTDDCANHCTNSVEDCGELGVDCGGGCRSCSPYEMKDKCPDSSAPCVSEATGECVSKNPLTNTCGCMINGVADPEGGETGRNCGGDWCPPCSNAGSHCFDRVQNQGEDGVDCGGDCAAQCATSATVSRKIGTSCTKELEVFTCLDRPDWDCWCRGGDVLPYHTKSTVVRASATYSGVSQEGKSWFFANSKFGIHTGWAAGSDYGNLLDGGNVGYVMNVVSTPGDYAALLAEYQNLPEGVVPIIRFCHGDNVDSCAFADVNVAAEFVQNMSAELGFPIAVISGPNEALQEPWVLPGGCAQENCVGQVDEVAQATADWMNAFLELTGSNPNLVHLTPDLNTTEPDFENFINALEAAGANFGALDGVAGNAYVGVEGSSIVDIVAYLENRFGKYGLNVFITEAGIDPNKQSISDADYQLLYNELMEIADDPEVMAALLFNPLPGFNPDPEFNKHEMTPTQYQEIVNGMAGTSVESAPVVAGQDIPVIPTPSNTTGGPKCSYGQCLYACTEYKNGQPNTYVSMNGNSGCPGIAGDTFVKWNDGTTEVINFTPGHFASRSVTGVCFYIHTWSTSFPEHEDICVSSGGANVGVGGASGGLYLPGLVGSTNAADDNLVEPGTYEVSSSNYDITTKTVHVLESGTVRFFYDVNENGEFDEGEEYLTDAESELIELTLQKKTDIVSYDLDEGWNSLAFPLLMLNEGTSQVISASALLTYLRSSGVDSTHVAAYRDQQFIMYSERANEEGGLEAYGTDFGIIPGEGYFVKTNEAGTVALGGELVADAIPVQLGVGWNLVGFYKENEPTLEAFALLDDITGNHIPADILTKRENGRYISVVLKDDEYYGSDFLVYPDEGYWVRVSSEGGFEEDTYTP